jgi:hypothetical protein
VTGGTTLSGGRLVNIVMNSGALDGGLHLVDQTNHNSEISDKRYDCMRHRWLQASSVLASQPEAVGSCVGRGEVNVR